MYPRASELKLGCKMALLRCALGWLKAREVIYYICGYIHQRIFISHTPSELNLSQIASAALWFMAYWGGIFPPSSETHVNTWAEVSRVTRGRTSPSSIQKDEKRKWAWCNIRCHVQQKPPCTHTHTHTLEHSRVSVRSECQHKRLR